MKLTRSSLSLLTEVAGAIATGFFVAGLIPRGYVPWVIAVGATASAVVLWVRMRRDYRHYDLVTSLMIAATDEFALAAIAFDDYIKTHVAAPIPDGTTQIVMAISETLRDLRVGVTDDERFKARLGARLDSLPAVCREPWKKP